MSADSRRQRSAEPPSMRSRVRERMNEQEATGGSWAVDIPQGRQLELKETHRGGVCVKRLDFLPYVTSNNPEVGKGEIWFRRSYGVHRGIGVDAKTRLCPKLTYKEACFVCEEQSEMYKAAKSKEDKDIAGALYHKKRELYNVIDRDDEDKGVQVFDISYHLFGKKLKVELDTAPDYRYDGFADLKGGFTLVCRFAKKTFGETEFFEIDRIDFEAREDYDEEVLKETIDLDTLFRPLTYDQLKKEMLGLEGEPEPEPALSEKEKVESPPARTASRRVSRQADTPPLETKKEPFSPRDEAPREEPAPRMARGVRRQETPAPKTDDPACPHGYAWGVDTDYKDECPVCEKSDPCGKAYDDRVAAQRRK